MQKMGELLQPDVLAQWDAVALDQVQTLWEYFCRLNLIVVMLYVVLDK